MKQYIVDAFADRVFGGNPAAVCILDAWLPDDLMQSITCENNLSETAFAVEQDGVYRLRWFTPGGEVDFCGHATLATGYTVLRFFHPEWQEVVFETMSGRLAVARSGDRYEMNFPAYQLEPVPVTDAMAEALGVRPLEAWMASDLVCVLETEQQVRELAPDMDKIKALDGLLVHATVAGSDYDCVSRSFAPKLRIPEDPVCGSGHCHILPYWFDKLHTDDLRAWQASARGGALYGKKEGDRIRLSGSAVLFAESELHI